MSGKHAGRCALVLSAGVVAVALAGRVAMAQDAVALRGEVYLAGKTLVPAFRNS